MGECSSNTQCGAGSANVPPPVVQTQTTTPVDNNLETAEVGYIQQVITAPVVINGNVVNPTTGQQTQQQETPVVTQPVQTPSPTQAPTNTCRDKNGMAIDESTVVVGATSGDSLGYSKCVGGMWINNCSKDPNVIRLCAIEDLTPTKVPEYLKPEYLAAIEAQKKLLSPATETYVAGPGQQTTSSTVSINNNSSVSTSSTCGKGCPSGQSCVLIGMGYYGCQNTATLTTYEKSDCGGTCSTNQECVHSNGGYVCKTVTYVPYTPQQPSNPCPAGSTYTNGTCVTNQQNITNVENQIANTSSSSQAASAGLKYSSRDECMAMENNNTYICNKYDAPSSLYQGLNILTSGKFGDYVTAYQQSPSAIQSTESVTKAINDCLTKGGNPQGCLTQTANMHQFATNDQLIAATNLGADITGKVASAIGAISIETTLANSIKLATTNTLTINGLKQIAGITLGETFKQMAQIQTSMNTLNAASSCLEGDTNCGMEITQATINWAFLGSIDAMENAMSTRNGMQAISAVKQSLFTNSAQAAVNIVNTVDTCKDGVDLNCGINIAGDALLGYGIYQNGVMAVNLQNSLNNFLATQNANSVAQNLPELTSGQISTTSMVDDVIDAQVGNIEDVWDEALGRFVSPVSNETALAIAQNQVPQLSSGQLSSQTNLALLPNVFINSAQLSAANLSGQIHLPASEMTGSINQPQGGSIPVPAKNGLNIAENSTAQKASNSNYQLIAEMLGIEIAPNFMAPTPGNPVPEPHFIPAEELENSLTTDARGVNEPKPESLADKNIPDSLPPIPPGLPTPEEVRKLYSEANTIVMPDNTVIIKPLPPTVISPNASNQGGNGKISIPVISTKITEVAAALTNPLLNPTSTAPIVPIGNIIGRNQVGPINDQSVSGQAIKIIPNIEEGTMYIQNTGKVPYKIGGITLSPFTEPVKISGGQTIVLSPNTSIIWNGSVTAPMFTMRVVENVPLASRIMGYETTNTINNLDGSQTVFFHPNDKITLSQGATSNLPPKVVNGKEVYYSYRKNGTLYYSKFDDTNIIPVNNGKTYFIDFYTLEPDGTFMPITDIFDGQTLPKTTRELGITASLRINQGSETTHTITHTSPSLILKVLENLPIDLPSLLKNFYAESDLNPLNWIGGGSPAGDASSGNTGPKISQRGSFHATFGFAAAIPVGIYYADQYLFDGYLTDKVTDIYNSTIDYLFGTNKQSNTLSKKLIVDYLKIPEQQGSNNPMERYEDPINVTNKSDTTTPPEGLTKTGEGKCGQDKENYCDGTRMYELYLWYKNQPNMWWNKDGNFTPADFLALMLIGEATGGDKEFMTAIMTATSNQLWGSSEKHKPYCNDATCEAGIFNFIGTYMQSAKERYNGLISNDGNPSAGTLRNLVAGQEATDKFADQGLTIDQIANDVIYNPISKVYNNDVPTQWGVTGCGKKCEGIDIEWLKNLNSTNGVDYNTTDRCGIYDFYGVGNVQAVVYTNNQLYNWSLENSPCTK